jgi:allantoin racemase
MKILYFIPGPMSQNQGQEELDRRRGILQGFASSGTEVAVQDAPEGPASIESSVEEHLAIPGVLKGTVDAEKEGFDALIVGCFGDPGVEPARELAEIPIIGPCESSLAASIPLGHKTSIITVLENVVYTQWRVARVAQLEQRLASVRAVEVPVLNLAKQRAHVLEAFVQQGKRAMEQDGADVLIPGCMSMAFLGIAEDVQKELGIPVLNPAAIALKTAELYVRLGLSHSKRAYPFPPKNTGIRGRG